jgi:hypothetical protein
VPKKITRRYAVCTESSTHLNSTSAPCILPQLIQLIKSSGSVGQIEKSRSPDSPEGIGAVSSAEICCSGEEQQSQARLETAACSIGNRIRKLHALPAKCTGGGDTRRISPAASCRHIPSSPPLRTCLPDASWPPRHRIPASPHRI